MHLVPTEFTSCKPGEPRKNLSDPRTLEEHIIYIITHWTMGFAIQVRNKVFTKEHDWNMIGYGEWDFVNYDYRVAEIKATMRKA